jgi:hypothetical protein
VARISGIHAPEFPEPTGYSKQRVKTKGAMGPLVSLHRASGGDFDEQRIALAATRN